MTDKTDFKDLIKTIISLKPDGNHCDLTDEYQNGYIEGQAEDILSVFVEQACEIVEFVADNDEFTVESIQRAIRDKFK